jgi:hypothetical protein
VANGKIGVPCRTQRRQMLKTKIVEILEVHIYNQSAIDRAADEIIKAVLDELPKVVCINGQYFSENTTSDLKGNKGYFTGWYNCRNEIRKKLEV